MAATSAASNNILLKELQKLKTALASYDQYIDTHVEKAMGYIKKTPKTERGKKRRDVQTESLVRAYLQPKRESKHEGFTLASSIKKNNELTETNPK